MRRLFLCALLAVAGCDDDDADAAARAASEALKKAKRGYGKAENGARRGYHTAKARVDAIDWVQAFESTRQTFERAKGKIEPDDGPPPADAWWTRGEEAVSCEPAHCTIAAWFVAEARSNPTRMMGDVKVLTALDDSGWLLDSVRPGSAAHAMGFRAGDVIRTIGGHPLTDGMARLEILAKLRKASETRVTFVRAGQTEETALTVRFET